MRTKAFIHRPKGPVSRNRPSVTAKQTHASPASTTGCKGLYRVSVSGEISLYRDVDTADLSASREGYVCYLLDTDSTRAQCVTPSGEVTEHEVSQSEDAATGIAVSEGATFYTREGEQIWRFEASQVAAMRYSDVTDPRIGTHGVVTR